ncbi:MAG TPA: hypothetical protein DD670_03420 [Planctomycetaceae bacterium]|nr:hypothetical protein [Planctomycetaceae bacterium]
MRCLAYVFISGVLVWFLPVANAQFTLARDGQSDYVIVLPDKPTEVEATAAGELRDHLEQVTGAKLEIVPENQAAPDRRAILIGAAERARRLLPEVDLKGLGPDGIVVRTVGDQLVLTGHPRRGTLYAVYTFLEDTIGCRWWTAEERFVPKKPTLEIPALDIVYSPKVKSREAFYRAFHNGDVSDGVFASRCKLNGHFAQIPPEYGSHEPFAGFVHTFYPLLPPDKYFAEHPEWYSLIDGKRISSWAQLCLTNDSMREEFTRNALALLKQTPNARIISISQNDCFNNCQCDKCKAVEQEEGSPAGLMLRFVNSVAAEIEKTHPEVLVETLAYQYTRTPPRLARPRENVVVRLCSIECSFVQPLADGPQNEAFRRDIEGWSRVAPRLYVWDYVTNFQGYILPHPNLRVLAPNIRYFVGRGVVGLFEQGDYGSSIGDFVRLRAWLLAHLMWNPDRDENQLIAEFLEGYYGAAAPHLLAYLNTINDAGERSGVYLRCFMPDPSVWLGLDDLNAATRHFEKAMDAVADDPVLVRRVRRERLPLDNVWLMCYDKMKQLAEKDGKEFLGPADPVAARREFVELARQHEAGQWVEGQPFENYAKHLLERYPDK